MSEKLKLTAVLLSALLITSCGNAAAANQNTNDEVQETASVTTAEAPAEETEEETGRAGTKDSLPDDLDFGGATIRIHTRGGDDEVKGEFFADGLNGEIVNDAVYNRNETVADRLNAKIEVDYSDLTRHSGENDYIRKVVQSGSDEFDIFAGHLNFSMTATMEGLFYDLNNMPYLDFGKPWWNDKFLQNSRILGKNYLILGDISQTMISGIYGVFFNQTLYEATYPDGVSLYSLVRDGSWTFDKLISYCSELYQDLDGDTKPSKGDRYGNYMRNDLSLISDAFVGGCDIELITLDSEDNMKYNGGDTRTLSFVEKMTELVFENNNSYRGTYNGDDQAIPLKNRTCMFVVWMMGLTTHLRDMEDDFGVIPMPKLDETQSKYNATIHDGSSIFGIPITCADPNRAAAALEALCAESYRQVTPAYFDYTLKGKYSRNAETEEIMDLLVASVNPDLSTIFGDALGYPLDMFRQFFGNKSANAKAVSTLASREQSTLERMSAIIEAYSEIK